MRRKSRRLTKKEQAALAAYERRCAVVRDQVPDAVPGRVRYGKGGIGKSFQVTKVFGLGKDSGEAVSTKDQVEGGKR